MAFKTSIRFFLILLLPAACGLAQTISTSYGPPAAANTWQKFAIPLTAEAFNTDSTTFASVMANVQMMRICTEMSDAKDEGALDNVGIGSIYQSNFNLGAEGWGAAGDGTMQWRADGGVPGGCLVISDWSTGIYHFAIAPFAWSGDWTPLIGDSLTFYYKTTHPDYQASIEISNAAQKRLLLTTDDFTIAAGNRGTITVTLSEPSPDRLPITLESSSPDFHVPSSISLAENQSSSEFEVTVSDTIKHDSVAVITARAAGYTESRITLKAKSRAEQTATVIGRVTDATTGVAIANATVSVLDQTTTTDANGDYRLLNIPAHMQNADFTGEPTSGVAPLTVQFTDYSAYQAIRATANNYIEYVSRIVLRAGETDTVHISLSPIITDSELRIVLNWGASPEDLDLYLLVPAVAGENGDQPFTVYYGKKANDLIGRYPYAMLDRDDQNGGGPETITIDQFIPGRYICFVHNYSRSPALTTSNAVVQIYGRSGLLHSVNVPLNGTGIYWHICDIDGNTGQVTIVDSITDIQPRLGGVHGLMKNSAPKSVAAAGIITWKWDFDGDGSVDATTQNPSHTYTEPGTYSVSLTVSDGSAEYTETKEDYITVTTTDTIPTFGGLNVNVTGVDLSNFPVVRCFTSVTDTILKMPTEELAVNHFEITEENREVSSLTVSPLAISAKAAVDIVFVLDITGSMGATINTLYERVLVFADSLASRGIDYRLGLVLFNDNVVALYDFTADAQEFRTWLGSVVATGGGDSRENALEGIKAATRLSFRNNAQRHALLLTNDDYHERGESGDGSTDQTTDSIIGLLDDFGLIMNVAGPNMRQHKRIAEASGGQYYWLMPTNFGDILGRLTNYLMKQYVISYVSPAPIPDENYRSVSLTVRKESQGGQGDTEYFIGRSRLLMNPPLILGRKDNNFTLDIRVESVHNLAAAEFQVIFDKTKLQALSVFEGDLFAQGGADAEFVREILNSTGRVDIKAKRTISGLPAGVSGSGLLAYITFKPLTENCSSTISFQYPLLYQKADSAGISEMNVVTNSASIYSLDEAEAWDLLCDFDADLDIDTRDFALLGTYWQSNIGGSGDVGPAQGEVPFLTVTPDDSVNYEDLFVFTRMWNWYHAALTASDIILGKTTSDMTWQEQSQTNDAEQRIALNLDFVQDLAMGHTVIHYETSDFAFKSARPGALLAPDACNVAWLVEEKRRGELDISFSRLTAAGLAAGVSGGGTLMTLDFERRQPNTTLSMHLKKVDFRTPRNTQIEVYSSINNEKMTQVHIPEIYALATFPNPFNSRTTIQFQLPEAQNVSIAVINVLGQSIYTSAAKHYEAGVHKLTWDGKDDMGRAVVTGTYWVRLQAEHRQLVRKILYLK